MSEEREPIRLLSETPDTVTLRRLDFDALCGELDDAEDRIAVLEHHLATAKNDAQTALTVEEVDRLLAGENPVKLWRDKRGMTQRELATAAGVSQSQLAEIEKGAKTGSIDTLRKLSGALKVQLDSLVGTRSWRLPESSEDMAVGQTSVTIQAAATVHVDARVETAEERERRRAREKTKHG